MSQLRTLLWIKWTLFRNSLRSKKAVTGRVASLIGMLIALLLALMVATGLGVVAYALTSPEIGFHLMTARSRRGRVLPSAEFIFFSIFAFSYLLWATLPLSIGTTRQFDPGNLLLYPISLRKLFAVDLLSEVVTLQSVFAIPSILAVGIGVGLGTGKVAGALVIALAAVVFGVTLSKWVSSSIGALIRRKRTRGETLLALIGAVAGLGGALLGQIAPVLFRHAESVTALRWTPPGAVAFALTEGLRRNQIGYALALLGLCAYSVVLVALTFWLEQRAILGAGSSKRKLRPSAATAKSHSYTGWNIPLVSADLAAVIEKELRYISRNAQLRMMTLMPLILIVIRLVNRRRFDASAMSPGANAFANDFGTYTQGILTAGGMLYVFVILSGLYCNQFALEGSGMRALILSPVDRRKILIGKNIAYTTVALVFSAGLLVINELVFKDITLAALLFTALCFPIFAALLSVVGNALSVRFPKPMKFGKRLNVSGVVGLLVIPLMLLLILPATAAVAAGYITRSLQVEYATLALLAAASVGFYLLVIKSQGETLQQREIEILEAVNAPDNG